MKRSKEDAADRFVASIERAIREYKRTKDAPAVPRSLTMLVEEAHDEWPNCKHDPRCSHRAMHEAATTMGRPVRVNG